MAYTEFTLWLVPAEPLRESLRAIVDRLAAAFDAVPFEPHVTLFCGASSEAEARAVTERIARRFGPVELTADRLGHTTAFTKTLFVQFRPSAAATELSDVARSYSPGSNYRFDPHLSLLYKRLPVESQRTLAATIETPAETYRFDRLRLTETELPIEDARPVRLWRTVCDLPLQGG
jgi:putative hydrolase of the HAD superfamily